MIIVVTTLYIYPKCAVIFEDRLIRSNDHIASLDLVLDDEWV